MTAKNPLRKPSGRGKSRGGTLVGLFIGLVLGVVIAAGVVWYLNKMPLPFQNKEPAGKERPRVEKGGEAARPDAAAPPAPPLALPGKPGDKASDKPRFEFYKILPGTEEAAPQPAPKAEPKDGKAAPVEVLYLQVGAFQSPADADNMKARLALMGMEASVQQATVPEKGLMHRVRIGPFRSPDDMAKARAQLAQNGIEAGIVKVRDGKDAKDGAK